jgi:hypothetical protein
LNYGYFADPFQGKQEALPADIGLSAGLFFISTEHLSGKIMQTNEAPRSRAPRNSFD